MQQSRNEQYHTLARLSFQNLCDAYPIDNTSPLSRNGSAVTPWTTAHAKPASIAVYGDLIDSALCAQGSATKNEPLEFGFIPKSEDTSKPVSKKRMRMDSEEQGEEVDEKLLKSREASKRHRMKQRAKVTELEAKVQQLEKDKQRLQDMLSWMMTQSVGGGAAPGGNAM
mmetsp:Transcript_10062/g.26408  ORF Transcript_10062/g.26408 Transcript_10062/m.26408 type:complete len:169 (-) Transcript_10062:55-561(-)